MQETSLLDLLTEMDGDSDDDAPSLFRNSPYCNNDSFTNILKSKSDKFSLLSLNCQSLQAKFDQFMIYVKDLENASCTLSAICLQETWLHNDSDTSLLQLDNYNFISKVRSCSAHGGVAIYLHNKFEYRILDHSSRSNIWDGVFIELHEKRNVRNFHNVKKLIICNIYRPPRNIIENYSAFIDEITSIICKLQRLRTEIVIVGDFNLDLLKMYTNSHVKEFFECMLSNGFLPKITLPTRLSENHGTLIDNIFCKLSNDFSETTAGILRFHISDHLPCFITLDYWSLSHHCQKYIKIHKTGPNSLNDFCREVSLNCNISNFNNDLMADPNINYNIINENITSSLKRHFPQKIVKYDKHKHKGNSWITHGIIRSIKYRDKLYAILKCTDPNDNSYQEKKLNLMNYNCILKQNIRLAKKPYYHSCFENFKDDIKKTWSAINSILNRSKNKKDISENFLVNNEYTSNAECISNAFNEFFINIGQDISQNIVVPHNRSFDEYLSPPY
jgi:exonuclease III